MNDFQSKYGLITGSSYNEVAPLARKEHNTIKKMTRRQPYVRSTYFNKDKVFINLLVNSTNLEQHSCKVIHRAK